MFAVPVQPPAISYPYRVKRKPVPSYDFDPSYSETDLKAPVICSSAAVSRSVDDLTSDLPKLSYTSRKPVPLYALQPASPPVVTRDNSRIIPSWPKGHRNHDWKTRGTDPSVQHPQIPQPSEHLAEPHYHKRTQSTPTVLLQATTPSSPGAPPPHYIYSHLQFDVTNSNISFPPPLRQEDVLPVNTYTVIDPVVNPSSPQNCASDGGHYYPSVSSHPRTSSENGPLSTMKPKGQKFGWLLRPIRMSLGVGWKESPQSESGRCNISLGPSEPTPPQSLPSTRRNVLRARRRRSFSVSSAIPGTTMRGSALLTSPVVGLGVDTEFGNLSHQPPQSLPPTRRNVLRARRRRSFSVSSTIPGTTVRDSALLTSPIVGLGVDTEFGNLSHQRNFAPPHLAPQDTSLTPSTRPARPRTSSALAHSWQRPRSGSYSLRQDFSRRPTTAPVASTAPTEDRMPTLGQLAEAASLYVIAESGVRVCFGDLFLGNRTVVVFIRHFWCPYCQDYMFSISNSVSPAALKRAGVSLIIISNGSNNMIQSYRKIFRTPFAVYTDPRHQVYRSLGMTLRTLDPGPESQRGGYIKHGVASGVAKVVLNAFKFRVPIWENGGDIEQLGGEFVLGPGLECTFAHRMRTTRSHAPIQRVLAAAGVDLYAPWELPARNSSKLFPMWSQAEETKWMQERNQSLAKLRDRKYLRRVGETSRGVVACENLREAPDADTVSDASLTVDDEVGVEKKVVVGRQSKATLAVVEHKAEAEYDDSHEEDQQTVGSGDTVAESTDESSATSTSSDATSFSSLTSYCNYECA